MYWLGRALEVIGMAGALAVLILGIGGMDMGSEMIGLVTSAAVFYVGRLIERRGRA